MEPIAENLSGKRMLQPMLMAACPCIIFAGLRLNLKFGGVNLRGRENMERKELFREDDRERS